MSRKSKGRVDLERDVSQSGGGPSRLQSGPNAQADEMDEAGVDQTDGRPYVVGYGKPPVSTRFKPGQSGNPKGRKKGIKSFAEILQDAVNEPVTVQTGKGKRRMLKLAVMVNSVLNQALKGNPKAMDSVLRMLNSAGLAGPSAMGADQTAAQEIAAEDEEILARYASRPPTS